MALRPSEARCGCRPHSARADSTRIGALPREHPPTHTPRLRSPSERHSAQAPFFAGLDVFKDPLAAAGVAQTRFAEVQLEKAQWRADAKIIEEGAKQRMYVERAEAKVRCPHTTGELIISGFK